VNLLSPLLFPLQGINFLRRRLSRGMAFPGHRVVSVGNITFGGSGKTPLVCALAEALLRRKISTAIFLRGYGRETKDRGGEVPLGGDVRRWGDEALLIKGRVPEARVFVGARRSLWMASPEAQGCRVFLLDDGFQHFAVARDLDILVHDFSSKDPLRRDFLGELSRGEYLFHSGEVSERVPARNLFPYRLRVEGLLADRGTPPPPGTEVGAFCGIAHPERFFRSLEEGGWRVLRRRCFRDHNPYRAGEGEELLKWNLPLITTEKDYVKVRGRIPGLSFLRIGVELEEAFVDALVERVEEKS